MERLKELIIDAGGKVEDDIFVTHIGCMLVQETTATDDFLDLCDKHNIDNVAEFNSRICYMSFPKREPAPSSSTTLLSKLVDLGHLSVFGDVSATFFIAGISDEVLKELVAHTEAKVSRLTSSKTKAMSKTLYRVFGLDEHIEMQKRHIRKFLVQREEYVKEMTESGHTSIEQENMFNLGMKASCCTFTMNLKDFHKLFIGRLPEPGNEHDIRLVCEMMRAELHRSYPMVIRESEFYLKSSNKAKYEIE